MIEHERPAGRAQIQLDVGQRRFVVKMNAFLVGDPTQGGAMDFAGLMKAWGRYFGAPSQGKLPTRMKVQVVALPTPGALVEIEAIAARNAARSLAAAE